MTLPVRHLPVLQNWDCHGCSDCCRAHRVHISDEERRRIQEQGWDQDPALGGLPWLVREGFWRRTYRLNQRADGSCVFLNEHGRCRIHEKFGSDAKPFPCKLYPFILVPAGDHYRVGLRFSCPSVAANLGRPVADHEEELRQYAALLEHYVGWDSGTPPPPPPLTGEQRVGWADLLTFAQAVRAVLGNQEDRMERRWRKCLALAALCRQARFDKLTGRRLVEFFNTVGAGIASEVPADPEQVPAPGWIGRVLFRQTVSVYARRDQGAFRGPATRNRLALMLAAWRFAVGRGMVPRVHAQLPEVAFEELEKPIGPLPEEAEQILERYYLVKVSSLQFCGAAHFNMPFWDGLEALALTFPAILWLTRAFHHCGLRLAEQSESRNRSNPKAEIESPSLAGAAEAIRQAITMVDHNLGFNPMLGTWRQRQNLHTLALRGELTKLIAWYSR